MNSYDNEWAAELDDDLFFIDKSKLPQEEPKGGAENDSKAD